MKFLLDVNALLALGVAEHEFHDRVARWASRQVGSSLVSCSLTELGFVRVLANVPAYGYSVAQASTLLQRVKKAAGMSFLIDDHDITHLPSWAKSAKPTTHGHLVELARAHSASLATLDTRIPGAFVIP